ncbi:MAG TPA: phosphodiester glycosidase family protein [Trebonia sp.]
MRAARATLVILCAGSALTASAQPGTASAAVTAPLAAGRGAPVTAAPPPTPPYWPPVTGEQATRPQVVTNGVDWHTETYQTAGGAQRAQVMDVDLADPNVRFGAVEAGNELIDPADETVSSMAGRTGAVAGVNADFFAIHKTGQPMGMLVQDGVLEASPVSSWPYDIEVLAGGQVKITTESFSGTADDTTAGSTEPLAAVNRIDQAGLTAVTRYLGAAPVPPSTVATAAVTGDMLTITSVSSTVTSLPRLAAGREDLIARKGSAAATWLAGTVHAGDTVALSETLAPYGAGEVRAAVSGGAYLVQDGRMAVPVRAGGENNVAYPIGGIGVTRDGEHAIMAVFDGRAGETAAVGLTRPQFAQWMMARGAYNAIEFDSGGSAEMAGRLPGRQQVSVLNTPSDGDERPVANGLFLYSTEASPGPAVTATVNNGQPAAVLAGTTEPLGAYATDADGNPSAGSVQVSAEPPALARVSGTRAGLRVTAAARPGSGWLVARAGRATSRVRLTVAARAASLSLSPAQPDLGNGGTRQFTLSGTATGGTPLALSARNATWRVSPSSLGTVTPGGLFTAAARGTGLTAVSATVGRMTAVASVAVGSQPEVIDPMTDVGNWTVSTANGATAALSRSVAQPGPGGAGSMDVRYAIPAASGVSQVIIKPAGSHHVTITTSPAGRAPDAIGLWVRGAGGRAGAPLANGTLTFSEAWLPGRGEADVFYPAAVTYDGWRLITAAVPAGTRFPLTLSFLDFLVINPAQQLAGDIYVSGLQALYPPRPPVPGHA